MLKDANVHASKAKKNKILSILILFTLRTYCNKNRAMTTTTPNIEHSYFAHHCRFGINFVMRQANTILRHFYNPVIKESQQYLSFDIGLKISDFNSEFNNVARSYFER